MSINIQLRNVTGEDIAEELNQYGIAVVGVGFPLPDDCKYKVRDIYAFVERRKIHRATPFLNMRTINVLYGDLKSGEDEQTIKEIWRLGWRYMPAADVAPETVHERIVSRLNAGQPVSLIPQTAKALRLNAHDIRALPLSIVERAFLNAAVRWTRLGNAPLLICLDLEDGKRRDIRVRLLFYWYSPVKIFRPINHRVVFGRGESSVSRLLRRAK